MMKSMDDDNYPRECDVICARGKNFNSHLGNEVFLKAVRANLKEYVEADGRFEKTLIVSHMLTTFRESGIRFFRLAKVPSSAKLKKKNCFSEHIKYGFNEINDERKIHEKIGHAFRDMLRAQCCNRSVITATDKARNKQERSPSTGFRTLLYHCPLSNQSDANVRSCQDEGHSVMEKHESFFDPVMHTIAIQKCQNGRNIMGKENQAVGSEEISDVTSTVHHGRQDACVLETLLVETENVEFNPSDWEELTNLDDDLVPHGIDVTHFLESKLSSLNRCHSNVDSSESSNQEDRQDIADDLTTASTPLPLLQFLDHDYQDDDCDTSISLSHDGLETWMETKTCAAPQQTLKLTLNLNSVSSEYVCSRRPPAIRYAFDLKRTLNIFDANQQDFPQFQNALSPLENDLGYFDLETLDESHADLF